MVVHVADRGRDMPGLAKYLYGPGRANLHQDQHMVAGSPELVYAWSGQLTPQEAGELGHYVEAAWRSKSAEQRTLLGIGQGGVSRAAGGADGAEHDGVVVQGADGDAEHVYHLIVSLPPGNEWTDDQWATVAQDMVTGMGFSSGPDDYEGCRWFAMRHGQSENGNEHMHIAVNLVREDGRTAHVPGNDFGLAQQVRREVEQRRDFVVPLHERGTNAGKSLPAYTMTEHQLAKKRAETTDQEVPDRMLIRQLVRAAAHTASTEKEWMHAVLDGGVGVELEAARWAPGGRDEVTGYQVRIGDGNWYSPTSFDRNLTLSKLRGKWAPNETDQSRAEALALWRGDQLPDPDTSVEIADEHLTAAAEQLSAWNDELDQLDPQDGLAWQRETGNAAATVAVLSRTAGATGEGFAIMADELTRQSLRDHGHEEGTGAGHAGSVDRAGTTESDFSRHRGTVPAAGPTRSELAARHMATALRATTPDSHRGWMAILRQLGRTFAAIDAAKTARGELTAARQLRANAIEQLDDITRQVAASAPAQPVRTGAELAEAKEAAQRQQWAKARAGAEPQPGTPGREPGGWQARRATPEQEQRRDGPRRRR